jgi:hypothetical protein
VQRDRRRDRHGAHRPRPRAGPSATGTAAADLGSILLLALALELVWGSVLELVLAYDGRSMRSPSDEVTVTWPGAMACTVKRPILLPSLTTRGCHA